MALFKKALLIIAWLYQAAGRIGPSTIYNGLMPSQMNNSYVYLDGNVGFLHKELDTQAPLSSYTISLWFRPHQLTADILRTIKLMTIKPVGFECLFTRFQSLQCLSGPSSEITARVNGMRTMNWYIIIIKAKQSQSALQIRELSYDSILSQNSRGSFFPQTSGNQLYYDKITLGIDDDLYSEGFIGNLRNFRLFTSFMDDNQLKRAQYTYVNPFGDNLRVQIILREIDDYQSIIGNSQGSIVGSIRNQKPITLQIDYTGIFWCWNGPNKAQIQEHWIDILQFNGQQALSPFSFRLDTQLTYIQAWVFRQYTPTMSNDQILMKHLDIFELKFSRSNPNFLTISNEARTTNTLTAPFPYQKWIFIEIQLSLTQMTVNLLDDDENSLYQGSLSGTHRVPTSARFFSFAKDFYGYLLGAKMFKDFPPIVGAHAFTPLDSTSLAYFYYLLTAPTSSPSNMPNLARQSTISALRLQSGSLRQTKGLYVKLRLDDDNPNSATMVGIPNENNFDGVTCINSRPKMRFASRSSQGIYGGIRSDLKINTYTIEFWFRMQQAFQGEAFLAVVRNEDNRQQNMVIKNERDNRLQCFASYTSNPSQAFKYIDFQFQNLGWTHVSCVYDWRNKQLNGFLSSKYINYAYYQDLNTESSLQANVEYKLFLNADPTQSSRGARGIYMSEFRFWRTQRSQQQIQNFRFQQLDPQAFRSQLFSYFKLQHGNQLTSSSSPLEYDLTDLSYSRQLSLIGQVSWQSLQQSQDLVICPVGLFKGDKRINGEPEITCFREAMLNLQLITYKDEGIGAYVITTMYSKFRSNYVRDNTANIFDFKWNIVRIQGGTPSKDAQVRSEIVKQRNFAEINIRYDNVSDGSGIYDLSIELSDKIRQQESQIEKITVRAMKCANIYDSSTFSSIVNIDIDSGKGQQDVLFRYAFSNCNNYRLDQNSMTFSIENDGVTLSNADHNAKDRTYNLKTIYQTSLPLNEYFFFKIKGVWRNTQKFQDSFEYYLIYQCRFISKLILSLNPSSTTLLKGQTLQIYHSASFSNINMIGKDKTYTMKWICPGNLSESCKNQGDVLRLNYDQFEKSGLNFWKPISITLEAYTNFIQGDGLKFSTKTVNIVWIDVNSDARIQLLDANQLSKYKNITIELDIPGLREDQINIKWAVTPPLNENCLPNDDFRKQMIIDIKCVTLGTIYTTTAVITYNMNSFVLWQGSQSFTVPRGPIDGSLSCSPTNPKAYIDKVTCVASNWRSTAGNQFKYQLYARSRQGILIAMSTIQTQNSLSAILPPSSAILVKVIDSRGTFNFGTLSRDINIQSTNKDIQDAIIKTAKLSAFTFNISSLSMISDYLWMIPALQQQSLVNQSLLMELAEPLSDYLNKQSLVIMSQPTSSQLSVDDRLFYAQASVQSCYIISNMTRNLTLQTYSNFQETMNRSVLGSSQIMQNLFDDQEYTKIIFDTLSNVIIGINQLKNNGSFDYDETIYSPEEINFKKNQTSNVTQITRDIIVAFDLYMSQSLGENQDYQFQTPAFNLSISKYPRIVPNLPPMEFNSTSSKLRYAFPLKTVQQPTDRQSLTQITFAQNPFTGANFLNQTATSRNTVYFAYRDQNGKYLDASKVPGVINFTFPYQYSPYIFLPNVTVCGYINQGDKYWENKSCNTTYNRQQGIIQCSCQHMSFYSIIDDYLERPMKLPLIQLKFKNWASFIAILYVLIIFIIGVIYTYNQDNQDFRYLHEQEELEGNEVEDDSQLSLVSLAFKRKVFFMDFSDSFSQITLFRIYMMLLHPIFQLKFRMDPHIPRFYRFLVLFSRVNICFAIAFFQLKDLPNPETSASSVSALIIFIFVASLLFIPLPVMIYTPFRSQYYLLKSKSDVPQQQQQKAPKIIDIDNPQSLNDEDQSGQDDELFARLTDLEIDASIPIKLLFLINALSIEKILQASEKSELYCTGDPTSVGSKLLELDPIPVIVEDKAATKLQTTNRTMLENVGNNTTKMNGEGQSARDIIVQGNNDNQDISIIQTNKKSQQFTLNLELTPQVASENKGGITRFDSGDVQDDENQRAGPDEEITASRKVMQQSKIKNQHNGKTSTYEGGERENMSPQNPMNGEPPEQPPNEEGGSEFSIDTNLFIDERKEIIEDVRYTNRFLGLIAMLVLNGGIFIAVLSRFIKEGYYNLDNSYVWVLSFFGAQAFGFLVIDPICLFLQVKFVSEWFRYKKVILAKFFRESLYIYEDYQFVVQFVKTKIS